MPRRRGWCRIGRQASAFVIALAIVLVAPARAADAHAVLEAASPSDGSTLDASPARIELRFSEPVIGALTRVTLRDGRQRTVTGLGTVKVGAGGVVVSAQAPPLAPDVYRLDWSTVSADDLHEVSGTVVFGVQRAATPAGPAAEAAPRPADVALRTLDLAATSGLVGAVAIWTWVLPPFAAWLRRRDGRAAASRLGLMDRTCLVLSIGAASVAMVTALTLAARQLAPGAGGAGRLWTVLHASAYGRWLGLRTLALVATIAILARGRRRRYEPGLSVVVLVFASLAFGAQTSHAVTDASSPVLVTILTAHEAAAGVWIGGLAVLIVLALVAGHSLDRGARIELLRRFGPLALGSAAVLVVSGLVLSGQQVASVEALLRTLYGRVLTAKLVVVGVVATLGLRHALALRRRRREALPPTTRSLTAEATTGAVVLGLAAVLTLAVPATGPQLDRSVTGGPPVARSGQADDLLLTLAVRPNHPGRNYVTIDVHDTRRPPPAGITSVTLTLHAPGGPTRDYTASNLGDGRFEVAGDQLDRAGPWRVEVAVQRSGVPDATWAQRWTVVRPARVPSATLGPLLDATAGVLAVLCAACAGVFWQRGSKRRAASRGQVGADGRGSVARPRGHVDRPRQHDADGGTRTGRAVDPHAPPVGLDDGLDECQAQAGAAGAVGRSVATTGKGLEQPVEVLGGDADAGVGHLDGDGRARAPH